MDYLRPVVFRPRYDMWTSERGGWLMAAVPAARVIPPPPLRRPTFVLLTQMRSYFDGSVPS